MDYHKNLVRLKVHSRLNDTFVGIIQDIPSADLKIGNNALIVRQKNNLMSFEQFYNIIYRIVSEYVPTENEDPILKAIKMLPKALQNACRIKQNYEIKKLQKKILNEYFYRAGNNNIKTKLSELETGIDILIEENNLKDLDETLSRFDERMRNGLLKDLNHLSQLLEKRK